jgi:squalene-hopene/tetraprenyl-beta-curcumene cyclase
VWPALIPEITLMTHGRPILLLAALLPAGCAPTTAVVAPPPAPDAAEQALAAGTRYLIDRQATDGAWRSDRYGHFRGGDALTPVVLSALLEARGAEAEAAYGRGVRHLAEGLRPEGGEDSPELNYPVYTAALSATILSRPENAAYRQARDAWLGLLRRQQLTEEGGWQPADEEYGGWGYASLPPRKPRPGESSSPLTESNLSATVFAVEALRAGGASADDPALVRALRFVRRCQSFPPGPGADGGFFFLHHDGERNKAGPVDAAATPLRFRSYGSTTADGLRALLGCGLPRDHARVRAALHWIERRFEPGTHSGDFALQRESSRNALFFYYTASLCRALRAVGATTLASSVGAVDWRKELAAELVRRQQRDGSWSNEVASMREDDPVLATAWAVTALALCLPPRAE